MSILKILSNSLCQNEEEIKVYLANASNKYKIYRIPKRTSGFRIIAQPAKTLKTYQRILIQHFNFPTHSSAIGYQKGKSIRDNALAHSRNSYLLKIDLENFFNSITPKLFWDSMELQSVSSPFFFAG